MAAGLDTFGSRAPCLEGTSEPVYLYRLDVLEKNGPRPGLPPAVFDQDPAGGAAAPGRRLRGDRRRTWRGWRPGMPKSPAQVELPFKPARVILQDFTGVPAVVDLAAMRAAMARLGGDPQARQPADPGRPGDRPLGAGGPVRLALRALLQRRARVRAQPRALRVPEVGPEGVRQLPRRAAGHGHRPPGQPGVPGEGGAARPRERRRSVAYPDTLVGTDSHTTMINGLGVLGWGVGGIEAEAVMLGQPIYMLTPQVVGFKLTGELPEGATATDLVLTVTQMLRAKGVVDKFVEFYGPGLSQAEPGRPRDDRQHGARVRRDDGLLPGRRRDAALPGR